MLRPLFINLFFFSGIILCFSGCGYQFNRGNLSDEYQTISISYAEGDEKGELTQAVIKKMSATGSLVYVSSGGDLQLEMKVVDLDDENIGFRYDRKKSGKLTHSLIPTETRLKGGVELSLVENSTGKIIRGPTLIRASVDYDHTFYTSRKKENIFSLGQLDDIDAATEAGMVPFNQKLAEKIVDYLINSW